MAAGFAGFAGGLLDGARFGWLALHTRLQGPTPGGAVERRQRVNGLLVLLVLLVAVAGISSVQRPATDGRYRCLVVRRHWPLLDLLVRARLKESPLVVFVVAQGRAPLPCHWSFAARTCR